MRLESQTSISVWAERTFGPVGSNASVAARANVEVAELLQLLAADDNHPKTGEEIADVVIVLYRLADRIGVDLHLAIDQKMAINRTRQWRLDGNGHGQHIPGADESHPTEVSR